MSAVPPVANTKATERIMPETFIAANFKVGRRPAGACGGYPSQVRS